MLALLVFLVIVPEINKTVAKREQMRQLQSQLTTLKRKRQLLESINSDNTVSLLTDATIALPDEKDAASVLYALENMSVSTGFGVKSIDLSPGVISSASSTLKVPKTEDAAKKSAAPGIGVSVSTGGTGDQFAKFLKTVLGSRRIFDIDAVSLSYNIDAPDFLISDFLLTTYYLPPITKIGDVDSTLPVITEKEKDLLGSLAQMQDVSSTPLNAGGATPSASLGKPNLFANQ